MKMASRWKISTSGVVTSSCTQSGRPILVLRCRAGVALSMVRQPPRELVAAPAGSSWTADGELLHGREPLGFTVSMILSENRVTLFGIMLVLSRFDSTIRYRKTIGEDV